MICLQENRSFDPNFGTASWAGNYGIPAGPPAPPRDRLARIGDLTSCFRQD